jgi:NAD(P)H-nitrite reductase large subunit
MEPDDELCLCFHVTLRKVVNYIRTHRPARASQLSDCFGAGTGCGWCRPFLRQLLAQYEEDRAASEVLPTPEEYARRRAHYIQAGGGTPPGDGQPAAGSPPESGP